VSGVFAEGGVDGAVDPDTAAGVSVGAGDIVPPGTSVLSLVLLAAGVVAAVEAGVPMPNRLLTIFIFKT
jgi:hypothetical protein